MTLIIGEEFGVTMPYGNVLGYVGENKLRKLLVVHPIFDGGVYTLKFKYSDGLIYEKEITEGKMEVEGALLREAGEIECQFFAYVQDDDGTQSLVFESEPFTLQIGGAIDGENSAIPTYEQSKTMLNTLLTQLKGLSAKEGYAVVSVSGISVQPQKAEKID